MRVVSNAFFSQAEVTQLDRWEYGPLEIRFVPEPRARIEFGGMVAEWNRGQTGGFVRPAENLEALQRQQWVGRNPNVVIAPTWNGYSELLGMLGSLLPEDTLRRSLIDRPSSNFWLWPCSEPVRFHSPEIVTARSIAELDRGAMEHLHRLVAVIPAAFERWIWSRLVRSRRFAMRDYSKCASLRLLSGDVRFWMSRLYRVAIDLYEQRPPVTSEDEDWRGLGELQQEFRSMIPEEDYAKYVIARPRVGGELWDSEDARERDRIAGLLINGDSTVASIQPVVDVLLGSPAHEDFSDRYSWIREDFERSFYSKRSKVKVTLHAFVDECPVQDGADTPGYDDILFRDLMGFFDERDRRIVLALRHGKTQCEIAEELGYSGHAAVSRRVEKIKRKLRRFLE